MKKRLGILTLAAVMLVQTFSFIPTFAADSAIEIINETYDKSYDPNLLWQPNGTAEAPQWTFEAGWWGKDDSYQPVTNGGQKTKKTLNDISGTQYYGGLWQKGYGQLNKVWTSHSGAWSLIIGTDSKMKDAKTDGDDYMGAVPGFMSGQVMSAGKNNYYSVAKVFTAPKSGVVKIGADSDANSANGYDGIIKAYKGDTNTHIKILSKVGNNNATTFMEGMEISQEVEDKIAKNTDGDYEYKFGSMYKTVEKGEKLYFVVYVPEGPWANASLVIWNPVVQYTEEYKVPSEVYQASKYYDNSNVSNGPWTWQYYTEETGYKDMGQNCSNAAMFSNEGAGNGYAWVAADTNSLSSVQKPDLTPAVGQCYMRPEVQKADEGYYARRMPKAVRTFTAPYTGKITVKADDGEGNSRIKSNMSDTKGYGAYVRIMYNGQKVWPNSSNVDGIQIPSGENGEKGAVEQKPFTLDVKKGDKLYFEVHGGSNDVQRDFWKALTYWDPVVTYEEAKSYAENIKVCDADGKVVTEDFDGAIAGGGCTVTADINAVYQNLGTVTLAAAVYDANGAVVSAGFDEKTLSKDDCKTYSITLDNISGAKGGYIKLFAFGGIDKLNPICIEVLGEGALTLLKADDSKLATFKSISGAFYAPYGGTLKIGGGAEQTVCVGDELSPNGSDVHYTSIRKEEKTVTAKTKQGASGKLMFEAADFLHAVGVNFETAVGTYSRKKAYIGEFNGADIEIPLSGAEAFYDGVNIELDDEIEQSEDGIYVSAEYFDCFYGIEISGEKAKITVERPEAAVDYTARMDALTGGEEVIDGDKIYDLSAANEGNFEAKAVEDESGRFEKVLRMKTITQPTALYDYRIGTDRSNVAYSYGDVIVTSFWARATEITDDTGAAYVGFAFENNDANYTKDVTAEVLVDSEWKKYYVVSKAPADREANSMWLFFYCGFKPQTVEVADFKMVNYKKTVDISELKDAEIPETYKGSEEGALWREQALKRIEKYRTDSFTVKVVDKSGNSISGADVSAKMNKSAFMFGTEQAGYNLDPISGYIKNYFNCITSSYAKLGMYDEAKVSGALNFAKANNMYSRGHALVYDHSKYMYDKTGTWDMYSDSWINNAYSNDESKAKKKFDEYIKDRLEKFPGFTQWDVLNEPDSNNNQYRSHFGDDFAAEWFNSFKNYAKNGEKAYVNSCLISGYDTQYGAANNFSDLIKSLQNNGAKIDGAGVQAHIRGLIYPQDLYNQMSIAAEHTDEVMITEFDIKTMTANTAVKLDDELELESSLVRDVLIAAYSNPKAAGFVTWGVSAYNQNQGLLLDKDFKEKPTVEMWKKLVLGEWKTNEGGKTDSNGEFKFRGHFGDYDLSASFGGKTASVKESLSKNGETVITITLGE